MTKKVVFIVSRQLSRNTVLSDSRPRDTNSRHSLKVSPRPRDTNSRHSLKVSPRSRDTNSRHSLKVSPRSRDTAQGPQTSLSSLLIFLPPFFPPFRGPDTHILLRAHELRNSKTKLLLPPKSASPKISFVLRNVSLCLLDLCVCMCM
jgi:hypothetical protein